MAPSGWTAIMDTSATESVRATPDWDAVPFAVDCARCGHDLFGQSEPKCSVCGLDFDWDQAVPIEHLTCPGCGYHLYGLRETRCPECGRAFSWDEVLSDYHRRRKPLFEYHWRDRPLRSLLWTWRQALRPGKFWRNVDLHDPVHVGPLAVMVSAKFAAFVSSFIVLGAAVAWLSHWSWARGSPRYARFAPSWQDLPRYLLRSLSSEEVYYVFGTFAVWCLLTLAALMIFRQSMRRCRVRTRHVIRAWALTVPLLAPAVLTIVMLCECVRSGAGIYLDDKVYVVPGTLAVLAFATYALWCAYRRYLRLPHSAAVVLSVQAIALMATTIVEMATVPNVGYAISFTVLERVGIL